MSLKKLQEIRDAGEKKLKPVIFKRSKSNYHGASEFKQNLLLKAMQQTNDVKKMKELTGIKSVAEIYRTLDKLSIRKEYHEALARQGISLDVIVAGIKDICLTSSSDRVKLAGYQVFLKSIGMDEYKENTTETGNNWEEKMKTIVQKEVNDVTDMNDDDKSEALLDETQDYKVIAPVVPEGKKEEIEREKKLGESLYE